MKLSVVVMAHPSRLRQAEDLRHELEAGIALDGTSNENANGDAAWGVAAWGRSDWAIVVQDDALPIGGFLQHAANALGFVDQAYGNAVVSFYTGTGQPRPDQVLTAVQDADREGAAWLQAETLLWGVAVAIPTRLVQGMLDAVLHIDARYDARIGRWAKRCGLPVLYTNPSLVDHADGETIAQKRRSNMKLPIRALPPRHAIRVGVPRSWDTHAVRIAARF